MTLTELRYVVAVARERHFGRAAASCFVSQPTLSVAIKKLEEELDITIFERHQHDVTPTPAGRRIVEQAERVLEQANVIRLIAEEDRDQLKGTVKLGVIYTVGPFLLPRLIPILTRRAPGLMLVIDEDFTVNLSRRLKSGDLDMIVISTPFETGGVTVEHLYDENFLVALPKGHPLAAKTQVHSDDLVNETLLLLKTGNCFRDQVMEACPACKSDTFSRDRIQKTLEGSSLDTIRQMVAAGTGVTVLPAASVEATGGVNDMLEYRPFAPPVPKREVALAYRTSYPREKVVTLVRESVAECGLALAGGDA